MTGPLRVQVDVTDTVATHWRAGIQRVVVQLIDQLSGDDRLDVVPVVWLESARSFRRLSPTEASRLAPAVPGAPSGRGPTAPGVPGVRARALAAVTARVRPLLGRLRRAVVRALVAIRVEPLLRSARRAVLRRTRDRELVPLVVELPPGSVLFEMDTVWNNTWVQRAALHRQLRDGGVHVAALVYDLLPQQHPEWFEASLVEVSDRTLAALAEHAELVLAISEHTAASFCSWARGIGADPPSPVVIELGADAARGSGTTVASPAELEGTRYVLSVGTVEPRKDHATLLDAFDQLLTELPEAHLVVVGRPGWNNDAVLARLEAHPELGRRLHWYRDAGDDLLHALYAAARVVAVTSVTEGYGLPVIEAMAHGVPVVSSDGGALVEAGGDLVEHVPAGDVEAWTDALRRHLCDDELDARRRAALVGYEPPSWARTGEQVAAALVDRFARS